MIVATIRNNEKGLFWVLRLPHFADAQINGIQKGCAAFRNREQELAFDVLHGLGKIRDLARFVGERNHEKLVLRVGGLEKFFDGLARTLNLAAHAATHVENHTKRYRGVFTGKMANVLLFFALVNLEIVLVKAGHQAIHRIGNRHRNQDQIHLGPDQRRMGPHCVTRQCVLLLELIGFHPRANVNVVYIRRLSNCTGNN